MASNSSYAYERRNALKGRKGMSKLTLIVLGGLFAASTARANTYVADCRGSAPGAGNAILSAAHALAEANPGTDTIQVLGVCDLSATGFRINTPIVLEGLGAPKFPVGPNSSSA